MEAAKMKDILKKQFGITTEEEFNKAVENMKGIGLGIFTVPIRRTNEEERNGISA